MTAHFQWTCAVIAVHFLASSVADTKNVQVYLPWTLTGLCTGKEVAPLSALLTLEASRPDRDASSVSRADRGAEIIKFCFYVLRSRGVSLSHVLLMLCVNRYGVTCLPQKKKTLPLYDIYERKSQKSRRIFKFLQFRTKRAIFSMNDGVGN